MGVANIIYGLLVVANDFNTTDFSRKTTNKKTGPVGIFRIVMAKRTDHGTNE